MDIVEQLRQEDNFTNSEKEIIKLILANPDILQTSTAKKLAEASYTSASTVIRLCQKVGCQSYAEFKVKFFAQWQKRENAQLFVDATIPFKSLDTYETVLHQITELDTIAIRQTQSLMNLQTFDRVVRMLNDAECIDVYGYGGNVKLFYNFAYKMGSIHRKVTINIDHHEQMLSAVAKHKNHCAILVSYSGETKNTLKYATLLRNNGIPTISITNSEYNSLIPLTDEHLYIATLENKNNANTKIGTFTSDISIFSITNFLYAGIFLLNYDQNYQYLLSDRIIFNDQ